MDWKKLASNLIWIAALVFLAWYFLWPVSLADTMPAGEGVLISVLSTDEAGVNRQTEFHLPAGSAARDRLMTLLEQYPCYRTINANSKNTTQGLPWNERYLIQNDGGTDAIYLYGSSKVTVNDTLLRMGWFNNRQSLAFVQALQALLQQTDTGIVVQSTRILNPSGQ